MQRLRWGSETALYMGKCGFRLWRSKRDQQEE
jgi:hypothetical protein